MTQNAESSTAHKEDTTVRLTSDSDKKEWNRVVLFMMIGSP